ncbi:MAG TPA: lysylphosphatidylglycerol synthase transmembrane domain-containing protein, partial [Candidatus Saccharimonadales bacterium]|nr:lysylphosphatidylglycerol synthase transmembrane domain-containing protein [Candidatus Saccharimonadales bacterium]
QAPFWWAFVYNLTEVLVIYVVYIAFGEWVNLGAIILAYAVANFAGLVSVLPGGVGIYEGLMTAVLATAGVRPALSLPVTVMYRVLSTLVQVPPGYLLYHRAIKGEDMRDKVTSDAAD